MPIDLTLMPKKQRLPFARMRKTQTLMPLSASRPIPRARKA
jgi:hypothetical protein